jgi:integrase
MVRLLSKMFEVARGNLNLKSFENPAKGIEMFDEPMRERALDDPELARLEKVLAESIKVQKDGTQKENPYAIAAIRLLILTGARRSEILNAKWEDVIWGEDGETPEFLRVPLPKEATRKKRRKEKRIPLAPAAATLIKNLPHVEGNLYIIVGKKAGTCFVGLSKVWERIRVEAKLVNVPGKADPRIHDLRHTWASQALKGGGVTIDDIRPIMGHSSAQTTLRYAHHADKEKAKTANAIAKKIGSAMAGKGSVRRKRRG